MTYSLEVRAGAPSGVFRGRSLDDVLGPGRLRYLATGHARVDRSVREITVTVDEVGLVVVEAVGSARYPEDWSVKRGSSREAHLSSIDAMILAEAAALHAVNGLADAQVTARVMSVDLRAGARAYTELSAVPIRCTVSPCSSTDTWVADCSVGALRVNLRLQPDASRHGSGHDHADAYREHQLGESSSGWETTLGDVSDDNLMLTAEHALSDTAPRSAMSILDLLRLSAQQAQVLIYLRDGIDREVADTLWMRRARFTRTDTAAPAAHVEMRLKITRESTMARGNHRWRLFDVEADGVPGMTAQASLAYRAP